MLTPQIYGCASPTDDDLDIDISHLTIRRVVDCEDAVSFELHGAIGSVRLLLDKPSSDSSRKRYLPRLQYWESHHTSLQLIGSPRRPSTLMEDDVEEWIPIPRRELAPPPQGKCWFAR